MHSDVGAIAPPSVVFQQKVWGLLQFFILNWRQLCGTVKICPSCLFLCIIEGHKDEENDQRPTICSLCNC